jgi:transposase
VKEYIQGKSYPSLEKEYGVAKSTLSGWVKKYSEECQISQPHTTNFPVFSPKEIQDLHKRIAELEKESLFLKKTRHSSQGKQISGVSLHRSI